MNENEVSNKLGEYRQAVGVSSKRPDRRRVSRPWVVLVPVGAIALGGFLLVAWPRYATAATLRRFGAALKSAKSFEGNMYFLNEKGKWDHWLRTCHEPGLSRIERLGAPNLQQLLIYKKGLAIEEFGTTKRSIVRPSEADRSPFQTEGEPIDIVKAQLFMVKDEDSSLTIEAAPDVDGNAVYKICYKKPTRRVEMLVSRSSDLPISADSWFESPKQHTHWDYRFNVDFPQGTFVATKGYEVIDLRQTLPAFLASHSSPLASQSGLGILDASVNDRGDIWIATHAHSGAAFETMPSSFTGEKGVTYAGPVTLQTSLSQSDPITIYGYFPIDRATVVPTICSMSLAHFTPGKPVPGHSDQVYASQVIPETGVLHFPVRREHSSLPRYFDQLGLDAGLRELSFQKDRSRASALAGKGRNLEAAKIYEHIASGSTPQFGGYYSWREQAIRCYDAAHDKVDADRIRAELAAHPR